MFAMHAPDGFLEPPVAVATALISVAFLVVALRRSAAELGDRQIPLAGITAAFVFAAQMFNFPVAAGTTGHLLGGALAAILLGPWVGMSVVSVVVVVQAVMFADGGISALGYNLLNMAIVPAFGSWAVFLLARRILPKSAAGVVGATGLAAGASVVLAAVAFSIEWLFGASAPVPFDTVFSAMVGVHLLIGIGEGVISAMTVGAVLGARSDLVVGAADVAHGPLSRRQPIGFRPFVLASLGIVVVVAAVVSQFAFGSPDGLERVAIDEGFADSGQDHVLAASPFAEYATRGLDHETVSLAVAGLAGSALVLAVAYGLFGGSRLVRRRGT